MQNFPLHLYSSPDCWPDYSDFACKTRKTRLDTQCAFHFSTRTNKKTGQS